MVKRVITAGVVHQLPEDLHQALEANTHVLKQWESFTLLARNEWICWVISPKKPETRQKRINVGIDKMAKGMRRPCCWEGCSHRQKS